MPFAASHAQNSWTTRSSPRPVSFPLERGYAQMPSFTLVTPVVVTTRHSNCRRGLPSFWEAIAQPDDLGFQFGDAVLEPGNRRNSARAAAEVRPRNHQVEAALE